MDASRQRLIFHLFARHFLEMGKTALSNGALNTTQIYLKQTERLAHMLIEFGEDEDATAYLNELEPIMRQTIRLLRVNSTTGPSLPRRQSFDHPPNHKLPPPTRPKDAYVNLTDIAQPTHALQRKDSEASTNTLKNLRKPKPPPAPKPRKVEVRAHVHHKSTNELPNEDVVNQNFITASQMIENSIRRAGLGGRMPPLRPNNELDNVRIRA